MRFSIAQLIAVIFLANIAICLTFAAPIEIGYPILTFISLFIIPPALLVGAINSRGSRQAFFLGCMISGMAHFIISVCLTVFMAIYFNDFATMFTGDDVAHLKYLHLCGYIVGLIGGCTGVGAYSLVTHEKNSKKAATPEQRVDPLADEFSESSIDSETEGDFVASQPR